jgi:hypothetical protein
LDSLPFSLPSVSLWLIPSSAFAKILKIIFGRLSLWASETQIATETLYRFETLYYFATVQKRWASLGSNCSLEPRPALDVRKSPSLRVLWEVGRYLANFCSDRWFRYVLLCLFTLPAPLVCSGPEQTLLCCALCPKRSCQVTGPISAIPIPTGENGSINVRPET